MKLATITFLIVTACPAMSAGQSITSIYARIAPPSPSSGNSAQIGAGVDGVYPLGGGIYADIDLSAVQETKTYVGNGWSLRGQSEALYRVNRAFLIGGGITAARHTNSQYTKYQYQPIATGHYRRSAATDVYASYLFKASGNDNQLHGYRVGYRGTYAATNSLRTGLFFQVEYTHFRFLTAFREQRTSGVVVLGVGISRIGK